MVGGHGREGADGPPSQGAFLVFHCYPGGEGMEGREGGREGEKGGRERREEEEGGRERREGGREGREKKE